jgi:hypothetical protein
MNETAPPKEQAQMVEYTGELFLKDSRFYFNVGQDFVVTTEDKIRLCLINHLSQSEKRNAWATPLGILLTLLIVFPTTTSFQKFVVSADTWQAVFIIATFLSFLWFIKSLWESKGSPPIREFFVSFWQETGSTIDDIVVTIKQTAIATEILPTDEQ